MTRVVNRAELYKIIAAAGGFGYDPYGDYSDENLTNGRSSLEWLNNAISDLENALHLAVAAKDDAAMRQYNREKAATDDDDT